MAEVDGEPWRLVFGTNAVFVGTSTGMVYSIDATTGGVNWEKALAGEVFASPVLTIGGYVYFQDAGDKLYCLQQADGFTVWTCDCPGYLPGRNPVQYAYTPSPTIDASGNVAVVGRDAVYYVSGLSGETLAGTAWPKWQRDPYNSGK
jgi:outer membrane protein assembly factor BamB